MKYERKDDDFIEVSDGEIYDIGIYFNYIPYSIYMSDEADKGKMVNIIKGISINNIPNALMNYNENDLNNQDPYFELVRNLFKIQNKDYNFEFSSLVPGNSSYNKNYFIGTEICSYIIPVKDENNNYGYVSYNSNNEVISFVLF